MELCTLLEKLTELQKQYGDNIDVKANDEYVTDVWVDRGAIHIA